MVSQLILFEVLVYYITAKHSKAAMTINSRYFRIDASNKMHLFYDITMRAENNDEQATVTHVLTATGRFHFSKSIRKEFCISKSTLRDKVDMAKVWKLPDRRKSVFFVIF